MEQQIMQMIETLEKMVKDYPEVDNLPGTIDSLKAALRGLRLSRKEMEMRKLDDALEEIA